VATGKLLHLLKDQGKAAAVRSVTFGTGGSTLWAADVLETVRSWEVTSARPSEKRILQRRKWGGASVQSILLGPGGARLACGTNDGVVRFWDVISGKLLWSHQKHQAPVQALGFDGQGQRLASAGRDGVVQVWKVANGNLLHTFKSRYPAPPMTAVAFAAGDGELVCGDDVGTVMVYGVDGVESERVLWARKGLNDSIRSVVLRTQGTMIAWGGLAGGLVVGMDLRHESFQPLRGPAAPVLQVTFDPQANSLCAVSADGSARFWDLSANRPSLAPQLGYPSRAPDTPLCSQGNAIPLPNEAGRRTEWERDPREEGPFPKKEQLTLPLAVALPSRGPLLAKVLRNEGILVGDIRTGQILHTLRPPRGEVQALAFDPQARMVAGGEGDGTVRVWKVKDGSLVWTLKAREAPVRALALDWRGQILVSAHAGGTVQLWSLRTAELLGTLRWEGPAVAASAFAPDGRTLATASETGTVELWDVASQRLIKTLPGHEMAVRSVAFHPQGRVMASGSDDQTVKVWCVPAGELLVTLVAGQGDQWVAYTPEGFFACSDAMMPFLGYRHGTVIYPAAEWERHFRNPDEVGQRLAQARGGDH
jgi:WD40 repeat protein